MLVNLLFINHGHNTGTKLQMLSQISVGEGGEDSDRLMRVYSQITTSLQPVRGILYCSSNICTVLKYMISYFPALGLKGLSHKIRMGQQHNEYYCNTNAMAYCRLQAGCLTNKIQKSIPPCYCRSPLHYSLQLCLEISVSSNSRNLSLFCKGERRKT